MLTQSGGMDASVKYFYASPLGVYAQGDSFAMLTFAPMRENHLIIPFALRGKVSYFYPNLCRRKAAEWMIYMNAEKIKILVDSCFVAKRITETMKELPSGIKPRHIHVIASIFTLHENSGEARISDVSQALNITTPSVTKLINELEAKDVLEKYSLGGDKRVTLVRLKELGYVYQSKFVTKYHSEWAQNLSDVTDEEADAVVRVIAKLQSAMPKWENNE